MRLLVGLLVLAPALLGAQVPVRRAWFTTIGDVWATRDGWVEWHIAQPDALPEHFDEYSGIRAYFAPAAARAWADAARRALVDTAGTAGRTVVPTLGDGVAEISLTVHRDPQGLRYEMHASNCQGSENVGPTRSELRLLIDVVDEAARVAASLQPAPAEWGPGPFSASEVTCPARQRRAYMPAWMPDFGQRPPDRGEAMVRFVVTDRGRIDLSSLVWDRAPASAAEHAARAAIADWQYEPASVGRRPVPQWSHAWVWFADSADAAEWQLAGRAQTRSFVARGDGRIEHAFLQRWRDSLRVPLEARRIREAFTPEAVRVWLDSRPQAQGGEVVLGAPGGVVRRGGQSAVYSGCAAFPTTGAGRKSDAGWASLADSVRTTVTEATRHPLAPIDSMRIHGETEVTCPTRPRGELARVLAHSPSGQEAVLSFVVGRDGEVSPASIVVLGDLASDAASRIRKALAEQEWEPGRLAGVRVPQRAHLVLHPAPTRPPTS